MEIRSRKYNHPKNEKYGSWKHQQMGRENICTIRNLQMSLWQMSTGHFYSIFGFFDENGGWLLSKCHCGLNAGIVVSISPACF